MYERCNPLCLREADKRDEIGATLTNRFRLFGIAFLLRRDVIQPCLVTLSAQNVFEG